MKKNMGAVDKNIRILMALVIAIMYFTNIISGTTAIILGILAIVFALTAFMSFCPLYLLLGINTGKKEQQ